MKDIAEACWLPEMLTIEVGARGLVGGSTFRAFVKLGFLASEANALCKILSTIVARCSYAVYLAHNSQTWTHNTDLVLYSRDSPSSPPLPLNTPESTTAQSESTTTNTDHKQDQETNKH